MTLSARNRLSGTVTSVETDGLMGQVALELSGGDTITAVITRESVENLDIEEGDTVTAVVKATEVMVESD